MRCLALMCVLALVARAEDPKAEFERRLKGLRPSDIEGHLALAEFALGHRLGPEAERAAKKVLMVSPGHPRAKELIEKARQPDPVPKPTPKDEVPKPPTDPVPKPPSDPVPGKPSDPPSEPEPDEPAGDGGLTKEQQAALAAAAKSMARSFSIKGFRFAVRRTSDGEYPEMQLTFENSDRPDFITLFFYAWSEKGKLFRNDRTYFGPDPGVKHVVMCGYHKNWIEPHGKPIAGRVEICFGTRQHRLVMVAADIGKGPKEWWKTEESSGPLGFFDVGQNPDESGTLRRVKKD